MDIFFFFQYFNTQCLWQIVTHMLYHILNKQSCNIKYINTKIKVTQDTNPDNRLYGNVKHQTRLNKIVFLTVTP